MKTYRWLITVSTGMAFLVSGCGTLQHAAGNAAHSTTLNSTNSAGGQGAAGTNSTGSTQLGNTTGSNSDSNTGAANSGGSTVSVVRGSDSNSAPANALGNTTASNYSANPGSMTPLQEWAAANSHPLVGTSHIKDTTVYASITNKSVVSRFNTVQFINQNVGWVAGNGRIFLTTDGGKHFSRQYHGNVNIQSLDAVDRNHVFAIGLEPNTPDTRVLLKTTNGGQTWNAMAAQSTVANRNIQQVDFVTPSVGYAIMGNRGNGHSKLYKTTDGGDKWTLVSLPAAPDGLGFASSQIGWVSAENGKLYKTTNGGARWQPTAVKLPKDRGGIQFRVINSRTVWMVVAGGAGMSQQSYAVLRTTDGIHWQPVLGLSTAGAGPAPAGAKQAPQGPGSSPGPFVAVNGKTAIMMGECEACGNGTSAIATTQNGGKSWTKPQSIQVSGLPSWNAMSFPTATNGWLVEGDRNNRILMHTVDGGNKWAPVYVSKHMTPGAGFWFVSPTFGYGLGLPGDKQAVLKTTNSGASWQKISELPTTSSRTSFSGAATHPLSFPTAADGWAANGTNAVYHTQNGGRNWTQVNLPQVGGGYTVVYFGSKNVGVALNPAFPNRAEVTTDGGQHWSQQTALSLPYAIAGVAPPALEPALHNLIHPETGRWVGFNGSISWLSGNAIGPGFFVKKGVHSMWQKVHFSNPGWVGMASLEYVNNNDAWLMTYAGNMYMTRDGGKTWALEN